MEEYIFKKAEISEWQKWLNQWKHEFVVKVLFTEIVDASGGIVEAVMLVSRIKK